MVGVWVFRIIGFWSWFSHALIFPIPMISLGARASGPQGAVRGDSASVGASAHQQGRVSNPPWQVSLGARASSSQCAVRGDKPSVGASAHQQGGTRPSLISLGARASGPQGAVRGDSASVGASAH